MEEFDIDSILSNIVDLHETNWTPIAKIPIVLKEIEKVKTEMKTFLNNNDFDISAVLKESNELCVESQQLIKEMKTCKQEIEEVTMDEILTSIESHDLITKELEAVNFAYKIVSDIINCGKYVKEFEERKEDQSYSRAVDIVYDLLTYVDNPSEGFNHLEIYSNAKVTGQLILEGLMHELLIEWDRMVNYGTRLDKNNCTVATITVALSESLSSIDILNALDKCKKLEEKVTDLAQFILKEILIPFMHHLCLTDSECDEVSIVCVSIEQKPNYKPTYEEVIGNIRLFFQYLREKLNFEFKRSVTIISLIGHQICEQFCEMIIKNVFIHTVPNNITDLQSYNLVTTVIQDFQVFLRSVHFLPENGPSLLSYMDNIDFLFADKSSQYFLETARGIMVKDLSISMSIGVEKLPNINRQIKMTNNDDVAEALSILDKTIPQSLFYFPRCMISKTTQELLDLVYGLMEQAVQCTDVVCRKLYNTSRLIFELYDAVVPYHHENFLLTIPQYVALFHNNCLYLAHNLQTLGDKWLNLMEGRQVNYAINFVDLVQKMRELGYKYLTMQMQQQRKQILDNIRTSDLNCMVGKDALGENAEAAIRQCLRQLQLLKNVWIGVFPANVFTRLMATLVNMFMDELIHRVCTVEDIPVEMATQLTDMYNLVVLKVPHLFHKTADVEKHVKPWPKFKEVIFVLGASLRDLDSHWNDGSGPLAIYFSTEELRSLIKALFQNTQYRANFLLKIK
ncbi:centromere/kinetochore protein zw10 homolog [Pieris brassicae]|uniref:centromere/kinetochore protein zw10 homolog n=1 Tax=Pieris brassicae TaxID=7116 RepID=UPI001E66256F|nr:centromere/kinetochore protein zw10 homolog [Pieris brassicae]